jgi:hypothetical protein
LGFSHWLFPTVLTEPVVVDGEGIIRTKRIILRAFRPTDHSVLAAIYAARADVLQEEYKSIMNQNK